MANTTNFGWETPDDTDLVKDGAAAIRTLGSAIDTSLVDLKGGTTNQVLAKNSNTDMDFKWVADASGIPATIFDAKGDLIAATAADTADRLPVGTNGQILSADSTTATGLKWISASSGKIGQIVFASTTTSAVNTTSTYADTGLTATITPTSASSQILILVTENGARRKGNTANASIKMRLMRGATEISQFAKSALYDQVSYVQNYATTLAQNYLDAPATTSATTYKLQFANGTNNIDGVEIRDNGEMSTIVLLEVLP